MRVSILLHFCLEIENFICILLHFFVKRPIFSLYFAAFLAKAQSLTLYFAVISANFRNFALYFAAKKHKIPNCCLYSAAFFLKKIGILLWKSTFCSKLQIDIFEVAAKYKLLFYLPHSSTKSCRRIDLWNPLTGYLENFLNLSVLKKSKKFLAKKFSKYPVVVEGLYRQVVGNNTNLKRNLT